MSALAKRAVSRSPAESAPGGGDTAERRRSTRAGRRRGCYIYITGEMLAECGIDPYGPAPDFKLWPGRRRTVLVQLYERRESP